MPTVFAEQCSSGYKAVLEGSGPLPGGTVRQVLHIRKIEPGGYDGQWMVYRFEQYNTWDRPMAHAINEIVKDKASDGSPINGVIQGAGNVMRTVMEGKLWHHQDVIAVAQYLLAVLGGPPPVAYSITSRGRRGR